MLLYLFIYIVLSYFREMELFGLRSFFRVDSFFFETPCYPTKLIL